MDQHFYTSGVVTQYIWSWDVVMGNMNDFQSKSGEAQEPILAPIHYCYVNCKLQ